MLFFGSKKTKEIADTTVNSDLCVKLDKTGESSYKEFAEGFFGFRGDLYYRVKGQAGKNVQTGVTFTTDVKEKYPDEFGKMTPSKLSDAISIETYEIVTIE